MFNEYSNVTTEKNQTMPVYLKRGIMFISGFRYQHLLGRA